MRKYPNLIGKRFGMLTVVEQAESASGQRRWVCRCDCGGMRVVPTGNLNSGRTTHCGCKKSPDLTGMVFGRLTVLGRSTRRSPRGGRTTPMWECRCACGNLTYKATDTLTNSDESMCKDCNGVVGAEMARKAAGFVGGTQLSKIIVSADRAGNSSGCRGVYYEKKTNRYRVRLKFKGKIMSFGSYENFSDAVAARKAAEEEYFGAFLRDYQQAE